MKLWAAGAALAVIVLWVGDAGAQPAGSMPPLVMPGAPPADAPMRPLGEAPPHEAVAAADALAQANAGLTIPLWSSTVVDGNTGESFGYTMVGQDPQVRLANPVTSVVAVVVPVRFVFMASSAVFDPTVVDSQCSPAGSALALTLASPIFSKSSLAVAGTEVGTGQLAGLFQRANFFKFAGPRGINPKFDFTLTPSVQSTLTVPVVGGTLAAAPCGQIGEIDKNTWDDYVRNTLFPMMKSILTPATLPVFLFYNVFLYTDTPAFCCMRGYHSVFSNPNHGDAMQTYVAAVFDTSGKFPGRDVTTLTHEVNEWQDDPLLANLAPSWGNVGQAVGCKSKLEVGDPLTGTILPVTMADGFTYHVQDLTFLSWFYHQRPAIGVAGLYSLFGTFVSPAAPCS